MKHRLSQQRQHRVHPYNRFGSTTFYRVPSHSIRDRHQSWGLMSLQTPQLKQINKPRPQIKCRHLHGTIKHSGTYHRHCYGSTWYRVPENIIRQRRQMLGGSWRKKKGHGAHITTSNDSRKGFFPKKLPTTSIIITIIHESYVNYIIVIMVHIQI